MLAGEGALTSGNNLKLKTLVGVSPIAGTVTFDAVLTPLAVLEVSLGGGLGTGWDFDLMDLSGLKLGTAMVPDPLGGIYYMGRAGAAFQFDTAAIFQGEWTSVVLRTYHEFNYKGYSAATDNTTVWEFENGGAMVNGFNYKAEYVLGYQMPLLVNLVGLQLETYAYNVLKDADGFYMDLSLLANFQFTEHLSVLTAVQFTNYGKDDGTRVIEKQEPAFKRVAAMVNYSF